MRRTVHGLAAVVLLLCLADAVAAQRVRTKLYFCRRTETPPVLDGALDDPCWAAAYRMEDFGFLRVGDQVGPAPPTIVRVIFDEAYMYFAFDCREPLMGKFRESIHSNHLIFWKDCLEWYLDTQNDDSGYCGLWANAVGDSFSERKIRFAWGLVTDLSFRLWARWNYAPAINDDGWVVEARVAMKDLGISPREGTVVGFNPCRFRLIVKPGQFLTWSTPGGSQKDPAAYGHMILGDAPKAFDQVLAALYPGYRDMIIEIPKGTSMDVYEAGVVRTLAYLDVASLRLREVTATADALQATLEATPAATPKTAERLAAANEELATVRAEIGNVDAMSETACLAALRKLEQVEGTCDNLSWDLKGAQALYALEQRIAARKEQP